MQTGDALKINKTMNSATTSKFGREVQISILIYLINYLISIYLSVSLIDKLSLQDGLEVVAAFVTFACTATTEKPFKRKPLNFKFYSIDRLNKELCSMLATWKEKFKMSLSNLWTIP